MHSFPSLFSTVLYLTAPGKAELATALFSLLTAPAALTTIPGLQEKKNLLVPFPLDARCHISR